MGKRAAVELLSTLVALAAVSVWMQLQDPTSPTRLYLDAQRDRLEEWSIRFRVNRLIEGEQS